MFVVGVVLVLSDNNIPGQPGMITVRWQGSHFDLPLRAVRPHVSLGAAQTPLAAASEPDSSIGLETMRALEEADSLKNLSAVSSAVFSAFVLQNADL
jgi:hypothetical protein